MRTRSWIAPSGQTPPQKTRPKTSANASGSAKNSTAEAGTAYRLLASASVTFWIAPIGQMQPPR